MMLQVLANMLYSNQIFFTIKLLLLLISNVDITFCLYTSTVVVSSPCEVDSDSPSGPSPTVTSAAAPVTVKPARQGEIFRLYVDVSTASTTALRMLNIYNVKLYGTVKVLSLRDTM